MMIKKIDRLKRLEKSVKKRRRGNQTQNEDSTNVTQLVSFVPIHWYTSLLLLYLYTFFSKCFQSNIIMVQLINVVVKKLFKKFCQKQVNDLSS